MNRSIKLTAELASGGSVAVEIHCDPSNLSPRDRELIRFFFERFMETSSDATAREGRGET